MSGFVVAPVSARARPRERWCSPQQPRNRWCLRRHQRLGSLESKPRSRTRDVCRSFRFLLKWTDSVSSSNERLPGRDSSFIHESPPGTFRERYAARLPEWLIERLDMLGFHQYTPVQRAALDHFLTPADTSSGLRSSRDAIIYSETGSGKTLAYLLPMLALVNPARSAVQGLIIVPTPELGVQVYRTARRLAAGYTGSGAVHAAPRRDRILVGMALNETSIDRQRRFFRDSPPKILVGIADRVEALAKMNKLRLHSVRMAVVDEVDVNLLSPAYRASLNALLNEHCISRIEERHTTVFVSATVPQHRHFMEYARQQGWMDGDIKLLSPDDKIDAAIVPTRVNLKSNPKTDSESALNTEESVSLGRRAALAANSVPNQIQHLYATCTDSRKKLKALVFLLERERTWITKAMVFCNESRNLHQIASYIRARNLFNETEIAMLTSGMPQRQRRNALERFRSGEARLLLTTDLASRGLDIPDTSHVFNFDLPETAEQYAHRVGRTGRIGREGRAISIITSAEHFVLERYSNRFMITFVDLITTLQS